MGLQTVHTLTGRTLEGGGGSPVSLVSQVPETIFVQAQEEETKSFLVKKGDEELQEAFRAANEKRPTHVSGGSSGGALASSAKTKDEMDQARMARLERLEAQQSEKKKEMDDATKKSKAH